MTWWKRPQFWLSIATCIVGTVLPALGVDIGAWGDILQLGGSANAGRHMTQPGAPTP